MAISRSVKMTFEAERGKYREKEIKWGVDKHFYTCNDNFSLADILEKPAESKLEKNSIKIVNLMVAESLLHFQKKSIIYSFSAFLAPSTKRKDSNIPIQRSDETKSQKKGIDAIHWIQFF